MAETVEKRCRMLDTRLPTAPNHYSSLTPTHTDGTGSFEPLGKHILSAQDFTRKKSTILPHVDNAP